MRIITGKYKGRHFDIPRSFKARPTTDFAKENIFNVLNGYIDFEDATALDLFAGTGSISLELLSRGCSQVVSVEMDRDHHRFISECMKKLLGDGLNLPRVCRVIRPATIPTANDQARIAENLHVMRQRRLRNAQIRQQLAGTLLPLPQGSQDTETIVIRKGFRDFGEIMLLSLHTDRPPLT